ncbi:MAG: hypothetical protein IJB88_06560 [Clostridia bacterium]|nr:hypothetical protein [Clostridia bacterium]
MKRFVATALLICLLFAVLPCSVSAKRGLTDADFLAFSAISVFDFAEGETVQQALERLRVWNTAWDETQGIPYAQLCKYIASYRAEIIFDQSLQNGFYAVLFSDTGTDGVLAFRSSAPPWSVGEDSIDAAHDWLGNDFPMELGNTMGTQYESAVEAYLLADARFRSVTVTGHSLGGAWADLVSALFGCRGVSFNAVSALDVLYRHDPERASTLFAGADAWNFVDHTNEYDVLAGMFETYAATEIKPYIAHKSNIEVDTQALDALKDAFRQSALDASLAEHLRSLIGSDIAFCHSLQSFVTTDSTGDVCLTKEVSRFEGQCGIVGEMATADCYVELGSRGTDNLNEGLLSYAPGTVYGGDGCDTLIGSVLADTLIGGKENDVLDGSWGDDTYLYRVGGGTDLIADAAGNDTLVLYSASDGILSTAISTDGLYIEVWLDQTLAARILRKARASDAGTFWVTCGTQTQELSACFDGTSYASRITVSGGNEVWIVDSLGKLIDTADETKSAAFGNVYLTGDGKYILDLRAGYTVKLIGKDGGTVEFRYQKAQNGALSHVQVLSGISLKDSYTATLARNAKGELTVRIDVAGFLRGDLNADGVADAQDYMMLKRAILGTYTLTPAQKNASDFNGDSETTALDYMMLKRCILGTYSI